MKKIAIVAWSPLAADSGWHPDGPLLPIEFVLISPERGLIPVLCGEEWVLNVRTLWKMSKYCDIDKARQDLAKKEDVEGDWHNEIGYTKKEGEGPDDRCQFSSLDKYPDLKTDVTKRLQRWRKEHHFDAVIWRDSRADLFPEPLPAGKTSIKVAKEWVKDKLKNQREDSSAVKYIRQVPTQVWTVIRAYIRVECNWVPAPLITTADDLRFKDWDQCRTTIGRLDTILVDLRKVGFSIITGLLTASALLNFLSISTTQNVKAPTTDVSAAVFITVMVLVAALFSVDTYYAVLLSGATERALDLEAQMDPWIRVTKYLSVNATRSGISYIILALYIVLLATAEGMGLFAAKGLNLAFVLWPPWDWVSIAGGVIFVVGIVVALWAYRQSDPKPDRRPVIAVMVLTALTVLLAQFLLSSPVANPLVRFLIVAAGMFLAIYMQFYWVYSAWRSGLYRQKPGREWPEGSKEKVSAL